MSNYGPVLSIEEFEAKYSPEMRIKFNAIIDLMASGNRAEAVAAIRALPSEEARLCKGYNDDLHHYNSLQRLRLDRQMDQIDHRLAVMKDEKREVLSQYHQDTAQNMGQFQADTSQHAETKKKAVKRHGCSVQ